MVTITVKTLYGFEDILEQEIQALGYSNTVQLNRAVQLKGKWKDVYRLNYLCRLAISVLVEVDHFKINEADDLYKKVKRIDWTSYFEKDKTFAVKGAVFSTLFNHSQYPYLVVKDAIADVFRDKTGDRPDVNIKSPQVLVDIYIKEKEVTLSLNTSGVPLFQRGYRQETGEAPMNEVLAAGLLKLSGWDGNSTFIDPMCGSGTLAIEAALMAADIPSMVERTHFAFKNFSSFNSDEWEEVLASSNRKPKKLDFPIIAADADAEVLQKAKRNSKSAPIGNMIEFRLSDFKTLEIPEGGGTLICNPPYGERMGEEIEILYESLGDFFKQKMNGFSCWIISSNLEAMKFVGLKPNQKDKVFNGNLECSFRKFDIFEGSKKVRTRSKTDNVSNDPDDTATVAEKPVRKSRVKPTEKKEINYKKVSSSYVARRREDEIEVEQQKEEKKTERTPRTAEKPIEKPAEKPADKPILTNNKEKLDKLRKYRQRD